MSAFEWEARAVLLEHWVIGPLLMLVMFTQWLGGYARHGFDAGFPVTRTGSGFALLSIQPRLSHSTTRMRSTRASASLCSR